MSNEAASVAGMGEARGRGAAAELRALLETSHALAPAGRVRERGDSQQCLVSFPHLLSTPALSQGPEESCMFQVGLGRPQAFLAAGTTERQGLKHPAKTGGQAKGQPNSG